MNKSKKCNGSQLIYDIGKKHRKIVRRYTKNKKFFNSQDKINNFCKEIYNVKDILEEQIFLLNRIGNKKTKKVKFSSLPNKKLISKKTNSNNGKSKKDKKKEAENKKKAEALKLAAKVSLVKKKEVENKKKAEALKLAQKVTLIKKKSVPVATKKLIKTVIQGARGLTKEQIKNLSEDIYDTGNPFFSNNQTRRDERNNKIKDYYAERGLIYKNESGDGDCLYRALIRLGHNDVLKKHIIRRNEVEVLRNQIADNLQNKVFDNRKTNHQIIEGILDNIEDGRNAHHNDIFQAIDKLGKVDNNIIDKDINNYTNDELDTILSFYLDKKRNYDWGGEIDIIIWTELNKKPVHRYIDNNNINDLKKGNYISESMAIGTKYKNKDNNVYALHYHDSHYSSVQHISNLPDDEIDKLLK